MAPLPSPEPFELLDTVEVVDTRKLRFERNRICLLYTSDAADE